VKGMLYLCRTHYCNVTVTPLYLLFSSSDICQKLSADVKQREWLVACCTHKVCENGTQVADAVLALNSMTEVIIIVSDN